MLHERKRRKRLSPLVVHAAASAVPLARSRTTRDSSPPNIYQEVSLNTHHLFDHANPWKNDAVPWISFCLDSSLILLVGYLWIFTLSLLLVLNFWIMLLSIFTLDGLE